MFGKLWIAVLATALFTSSAFSQSPEIRWFTIDGGGGVSTSGGLTVSGTFGQPDAGTLSGGGLTLSGGFWVAAVANPCTLSGDVDSDGDVDLTDLSTLLANFGTISGGTLQQGDLDGDGDIDLTDLSTLLANFGTMCP